MDETSNGPDLNSKLIESFLRAKQIYKRQPPTRHYRSIKREILRYMCASRAVQMAAMEDHLELLRKCGHYAELVIVSGIEMKLIRIKAAKHIFEQCKKSGTLPKDAKFVDSVVDLSDIEDNNRYYGGFIFIPSIASHFCIHGRMTSSADAAHCEGKGPQSYGTTFEVVTYDTNYNIVPIAFAHFVGAECHQYWSNVFRACKNIDGFDIPDRTVVVDQEKSIDTSFKEIFSHAKMFLDPMHVKKNMGSKLGRFKASGISYYEQALRAPSKEEVDRIIEYYSDEQKTYLKSFEKPELYTAYSNLQDNVESSQSAESQMRSSIRNQIRTVEPQQMLVNLVLTQRSNFWKRKADALKTNKPVPPRVEAQIATLIQRSRVYQNTVNFVDGSDLMEATVKSYTNGSQSRLVRLSIEKQKVPSCCAYSKVKNGYPCLHGMAVLTEKHGRTNIHNFIDKRHLSMKWKDQYENVSFDLPTQADVDRIMVHAKVIVAKGENVRIPKALPPPRGRPVKGAGKRKKGWYERGPEAAKRRAYGCALCHQDDHNRLQCPLAQLYDNSQDSHLV